MVILNIGKYKPRLYYDFTFYFNFFLRNTGTGNGRDTRIQHFLDIINLTQEPQKIADPAPRAPEKLFIVFLPTFHAARHENKRIWQRHVTARNQLLTTLSIKKVQIKIQVQITNKFGTVLTLVFMKGRFLASSIEICTRIFPSLALHKNMTKLRGIELIINAAQRKVSSAHFPHKNFNYGNYKKKNA
jgi:hypothetical protein